MSVAEQPVTIGQLVLALEDSGALTPTALVLTDRDMPFERYEAIMGFVGRVKRTSSWWVGDAIVFGEGIYGEQFAQAMAVTGLSEQTLLQYQFVCQNIPPERRRESLSFGVHELVARDPGDEQEAWLSQAEKKGWGVKELRAARAAKRKETKPQIPGTVDDPPSNTVDFGILQEAGLAVIRDARDHELDPSLVTIPRETLSRVQAAFGE